jgi:hypothetical protein
MVRVKLLKDVVQGGHLKTTRRRNPNWRPGTSEQEFEHVPFIKGAIVTMHEESAKKWLAQGLIEVLPEVSDGSGGE